MRIFLLLIFMVPSASFAQGLRKTYATETFLEGMKNSAKKRCSNGGLLRKCFSVNQATCEDRVSSRLEGCIRDQRIRLMGQNKLIELAARQAEGEVDACVNSEYYALSRSSFNSLPACSVFSKGYSPAPTAGKTARSELRTKSFEDPLEDQRSITDSYKLRLIEDIRKVRTFKADLSARKVCPGYRGKDVSGCFKQGLESFTITSSPQIVEMMVVATYAGILDKDSKHAKGRERMVDNILSILERTDLQKFHLAKFNPVGEVDKLSLAQLRQQDLEMLQVVLRKTSDTLAPYLKENGGRLMRQPASAVDFQGRMDFQLQREWNY